MTHRAMSRCCTMKHFIYGYMASDIWLRTILIVRQETRCRHIGYSYRLTAMVLLYAPFHRQDSTYHGLCYTSRVALAGTRNANSRSFRSPNFYSTDNILQYSVTSKPSTELFPSHPSLTHSNGNSWLCQKYRLLIGSENIALQGTLS